MQAFIEHLSGNRNIKFPFSEQSSLHEYVLPRLFVDLTIMTPMFMSAHYLSSLVVRSSEFDIYINGDLFFQNVPKQQNDDYYSYESTVGSANCKIVIVPSAIQDVPVGTHVFTTQETKFEESCIVPPGERVITITSNSISLDEDIIIADGYNSSLSFSDNDIKIAFLPGYGQGAAPCENDGLPDAIYSINRNNFGRNYAITGSECIEIINDPVNKMIIVHDRCKPCCGECDDAIDGTNTASNTIQDELDDLESRIEALEA